MFVESRFCTLKLKGKITLELITKHLTKQLKPNEDIIKWAILKKENDKYLIEYAVINSN